MTVSSDTKFEQQNSNSKFSKTLKLIYENLFFLFLKNYSQNLVQTYNK